MTSGVGGDPALPLVVTKDFEGLKCRAELQIGGRSCSELVVNECAVFLIPCRIRWLPHAGIARLQGGSCCDDILLSVPFPEINNGVEPTDELSFCSENGFANEMVTPTDPRDTKLRIS